MADGMPPADDFDDPEPSEEERYDEGPSPRMPPGDDFDDKDGDDD